MIFEPPNCPKCGSAAIAPTRQGMSIPYKCTSETCGHSFGLIFAMSDISRFQELYAEETDVVLANTNVKLFHKPTQA